ncbi:hypothetical protein [Paraliomyxa miuraensis]|uniref:hypothetical protein n=1 Tax=Paraliomyxa miuraensis TaxID=376150 RepID=UPI0022591DA1|nr:hypothetical protein [Paraliomyxa miuraensis]MCX4244908.1 hypothetical protein [Paraliomyxa miuraensis]
MATPKTPDAEGSEPTALARRRGSAAVPWRGDEHVLAVEAAAEAGLDRGDVELDLYTQGFSSGMTVDDPLDGAIVARGRTVLRERELLRSLRPALQYLGVPADAVKLRIHDGSFELRVSKHAAEASRPALDAGKQALKLWLGFGLLGLAGYQLLAPFVAAIVWSAGLLLGGWQLRRGMASGRAMLAGRLAIGLGMLAQEEKIILPPVDAPTEDLS